MRRSSSRALLFAGAIALAGARAGAQVVPDAEYRTLETPHFRVHYTRDLDSLARRAAVSAERAYGRLSRELAPPRGPLDLVVADNVDYSNGFATTFPTNRIVVYATPPVEGALRNYADWMDLVVTHELTHIFHLDRTRGIWRLGQRVFGRNPALFPNAYSPSWLTEGLAVYFESRLTGSGRLAGTAHRVQALAAAAGGASPRLDQLSASTPAFPGGSTAYVWGSLAVEQLAASSDSGGVRRFVDASAGQLIPFRLNHAARRGFGRSFSSAWRAWSDSVDRSAGALRVDSAWKLIGGPAWDAAAPRWTNGGRTVAWPATFPREVPALWLADSAGALHRAGRRNTLDVNTPRPGGGFVFGQLDYVDAFRVRADLWVVDANGDRHRLTRDARLVQPDVRADGEIAAVQIVGGTTRLVRLSERDTRIIAITGTHPDTQWSEPRWGGVDGRELAAVRRVRGGRAEIVRMDTSGVASVITASDRVEASPSWSDACAIWSVSDRAGLPLPMVTAVSCGSKAPLAFAATGVAPGTAGVVSVDAPPRSSTGGAPGPSLAAVTIGARGYRLALGTPTQLERVDSLRVLGDSIAAPRLALMDTAGRGAAALRSHDYSPWRMLVPRWWLPLVGENDLGTTTLGAYSSGSDIVGRHLWTAQATVPVRRPQEWEGAFGWRYRGFGQPALDFSIEQEWVQFLARLTDPQTGDTGTARLARADRTVSLGLSFVRPRIYTSASLAVGADYEWFAPFDVEPFTLRASIDPRNFERRGLPGAYLSAGWSALQRAPQAVSVEDGVSVGLTLRQRWQGEYDVPNAQRAVGTLRAYKSLDLAGYAKHVLAARLAAAWQSDASFNVYDAGGTSGSSVEILPGVDVGDAARTFGVRGWAPATLVGSRALGASFEYRAPLSLPNRGFGVSPFYLARTGLTFFGDAASAWCTPSAYRTCLGTSSQRRWIGGVGAELWLDASASYDVPYRLRLGVAEPYRSWDDPLRTSRWQSPQLYATFGTAF